MVLSNASSERWGPRVIRGLVAGHEGLLYERRPRSVAELLIDAQRWASRDFIVQGERRITGKQHLEAVVRVVGFLRERGVRPRDPVVLLSYNSIEWLVAFWALQSLGAMAVLGNPWWSDAETAVIMRTVKPSLIISDRSRQRFLAPDGDYVAFGELRRLVDGGLSRRSAQVQHGVLPHDELIAHLQGKAEESEEYLGGNH